MHVENLKLADTDLQSETEHHNLQQYTKITYAFCLTTGP